VKQYKSFIFLVLVLLFTAGFYIFFMPERVSDFVKQFNGFVNSHDSGRKATIDNKNFLAQLKKRDSAMMEINAQYFINPEIFAYDLQNVPFEPFVYDINNPLKQLYTDLLQLRQNPQLLRVLHYGDEQIENDKITKDFRELLQHAFGGEGSGIIPLFQSDYRGVLSIKLSDNWSVMSMQKNQRRGNYGLCNAYLYPPAINALITVGNTEKGTVKIRGIAGCSGVSGNTGGGGLFLESLLHGDVWVERDLQITALTGAAGNVAAGSKTKSGKLTTKSVWADEHRLGAPVKQENSYGLQHYAWKLPDSTTGINVSLSLLKNRNIYALSINSSAGIVVDNISLRGSTGNIFLKNNRRFLIDNYALMNVRLVIYQFTSQKSQDFYKTMLQQELGYLRITVPDVPIIVIGNSGTLRKVALENGCVFWNLQESNNAEFAGKMLYKAFVSDYKNFVTKERERKINEL
jgi:hypothetical protein